MLDFKTYKEIQNLLGEAIKNERLAGGLYTQAMLAEKADIPLSTYKRLEGKGEGSLKDFVKILIALKKTDKLEKFIELSDKSLIVQNERNHKERKRIRR